MSEANAQNGGFEFRETGGYDRAQVDSFINEVKKYIASQKNEKQLLTQKLHVLAVKIQEYQSFEKEHGELSGLCESLRSESEKLKSEIAEMKSEKEELALRIEKAVAEAEALEKENASLSEQVEALGTEKGRLSAVGAGEQRQITENMKAAVAAGIEELKAELTRRCDEIKAKVSETEEAACAAEADEKKPSERNTGASGLTVADLISGGDGEEKPAADREPTDEETRQSRDAARSVLRSMTGVENDEGPTKLMPDDLARINMTGGAEKSVGIVINAKKSEKAPEEATVGWSAPEDSRDESNDSASDREESSEQETSSAALTPEESAHLSYDDALALVLKKNGINPASAAAEKKPETAAESSAKAADVKPEEIRAAVENDSARAQKKGEGKPKKEKRGFFSALKRNIDAILEDDEDEEEDEYTGTEIFTPSDNQKASDADDQPTLRFGKDYDVKKH